MPARHIMKDWLFCRLVVLFPFSFWLYHKEDAVGGLLLQRSEGAVAEAEDRHHQHHHHHIHGNGDYDDDDDVDDDDDHDDDHDDDEVRPSF